MDRRRFLTGLAGILAAGAAPAVVRAGSLMRVRPIILPQYYDVPEFKFGPFSCADDALAQELQRVMLEEDRKLVEIDEALRQFWDEFSVRPTRIYFYDPLSGAGCFSRPLPPARSPILHDHSLLRSAKPLHPVVTPLRNRVTKRRPT